jgi:hypothetical protein
MAATIKVRCIRPILLNGERIEAGVVLELDAVGAAEAVGSSRGEYVDPADAARAQAAVAEQCERMLRRLSAGEQ